MTVLFLAFQQTLIACVVFPKVKASCYVIVKIITVFLTVEEKNSLFFNSEI